MCFTCQVCRAKWNLKKWQSLRRKKPAVRMRKAEGERDKLNRGVSLRDTNGEEKGEDTEGEMEGWEAGSEVGRRVWFGSELLGVFVWRRRQCINCCIMCEFCIAVCVCVRTYKTCTWIQRQYCRRGYTFILVYHCVCVCVSSLLWAINIKVSVCTYIFVRTNCITLVFRVKGRKCIISILDSQV